MNEQERERIDALERRIRILELCLDEIEVRLKIRRKPQPAALELPKPSGLPVRKGKPGGPVQR